jgi:Uma2 family endonuclease
MTAILDLPEVRRRVSPLTVEEYHRPGELNENDKRTELIRGIVIEKMSKSPLRATIASRLFKMILPLVPEGYTVRKEGPLTLRDSEPEPDISVVKGSDSDFAKSHPAAAALVVEIAVNSVELDRELALLYAEAGVEEYWIVLGNERSVEIYRRPVNGIYAEKTTIAPKGKLTCGSVAGVSVSLEQLFI